MVKEKYQSSTGDNDDIEIIEDGLEDKDDFSIEIDDENVHEIFNYRTLEEMETNHSQPMGVELMFTHKDKKFVIEKTITVRKLSEKKCKIEGKKYKVYTYKEGQGKKPYDVGKPIKGHEELTDILEKLVPHLNDGKPANLLELDKL